MGDLNSPNDRTKPGSLKEIVHLRAVASPPGVPGGPGTPMFARCSLRRPQDSQDFSINPMAPPPPQTCRWLPHMPGWPPHSKFRGDAPAFGNFLTACFHSMLHYSFILYYQKWSLNTNLCDDKHVIINFIETMFVPFCARHLPSSGLSAYQIQSSPRSRNSDHDYIGNET